MNKAIKYSVYISILCHILLFFGVVGGVNLGWFDFEIKENKIDDSIVFDFTPELIPPKKKLPNEIIETPDDAKTVQEQENADFLSDKNAVARNSEADPDVKIGDAFSRGEMKSHEVLEKKIIQQQQDESSEEIKKENDSKNTEKYDAKNPNYYASLQQEKFDPNLLTKQPRQSSEVNSLTAKHDNQDSRVEDWGSFTLNTYDWDFAPYMLYVRRTVNGNVYPPPAFLRMGIIDGKTLIRFRIYPGGEMKNLEVVKYIGHRTLMETSYKAIEVSAPFPPLPSDFPEPYLEIHYSFTYQITKPK